MSNLTLHPMKEIRIIIQGEHLKFATDLLDNKATGYTIIHNISGKGHHGFQSSAPCPAGHEARACLVSGVAFPMLSFCLL